MVYKILFITKILTHGGAQRVCASLANGLSLRGHEVSILADFTIGKPYKTEEHVRLVQVDSYTNSGKFFKQLNFLCKKEKYNIIINFEGLKTFYSVLAAKINGIPIIYSEHNSFERPHSAPMPIYEYFKKYYLSRIYDCLTVLTQRDASLLKDKVSNVYIMPNPLFLSPLSEIPLKEKTVLAVGRLNAWHVKGFDVLMEAWSNIQHIYPDWTLTIVGGGELEDKEFLMGLAKQKNVKRLKVIDYKSDIVEEYRNSEVFVLSSRYEGFGLVLIEALSQRCACIACDYLGRQSEIIENEINGLTCQADSVNDLQSALFTVLGNEQLRKNIQLNSILGISKFSEANVAERWELLIKKIVK